MSNSNFVARIAAVRLYPLSEEEIKSNTAVIVTNKDQFSDRGPEPHGIYDSRMGTIYSKYDCATCSQGIRKCPGHYGSYELKYPICNIIMLKNAFKFLKITCIYCKRFIMDPSKPIYNFSPSTVAVVDGTLDFIIKNKIKQSGKVGKIFCDYCNEGKQNITKVQPQYIMKSPSDQNKIKVKAVHSGDKYKSASGNEYQRSIYNYEILRLFESVPDSEMIKFGMPIEAHPRHYYTRQLVIIPANMRFINNDNKNSYSNQHTASIEKIIKANNDINDEIPSKENTIEFGAFMDKVENLIRQYVEYIKVKANSDSNDAIYSKLKGKKGITRLSQLGKNVGKVFRVVITCDTSCPIDTIKIPKHFAQILTVDETVTEYNFNRLQLLFNNGPNYPGYNEITSARNGKKYDSRNSTYRLQIGDIIHRHLLDGDTVPFHRFPTLTATCTTVMKMLVHRSNNSSVAFNVLACDFFGADYDGDTMMGFMIGHEGVRFEAEYVMNMNNNYLEGKVTSGSNISILGQVLDSVLGFGLITRNFVKFSRYQVNDLIRDVQVNQKLTKKEYTGREVMSLVMPRIKYIAPSPFFANKTITSYMSFRGKDDSRSGSGLTQFDDSDREIRIIDGQILSGIVCGSAVKNSPGSIYHLIYDQYGSKTAHKIMFYHQQIIKRYLEVECFSIGYKDIVLDKKAYELMDLTQSRIMAQLSELKNRLMNKNIIPPLGKDIATYVDEEVLKIHSNAETAYLWAILNGCKPEENAFFVSCLTGAKGKLANIYNMLSPLGQIKIDGKRIPATLDFQRYDCWTPQFSLDAHVGGYVHKSYSQGIPFRSMYNNCKAARNNVLTKGLVVGEAGSAGREIIKGLESLIVDNRMFTVRNFGENIVEFAIADDGFESSTIISNDYFILSKTDEEVKQMFTPKKFNNDNITKIIDKIIDDKREFITIQMAKESSNYGFECGKSLQVPFNINQMVYIITGDDKAEPTKSEYNEMIDYLEDFIDTIHYIKINSVHKAKRTQLLKTTLLTMTSIRMLIRLYFNPAFLETCSLIWLKMLCGNIAAKIIDVLYIPGKNIGTINGQTLTAPLTQYLIDAHHAAASGGTSRDGLKYYKQVVALKPIDKLADIFKRMYIYLKDKYEENKSIADELANFIGTIHFEIFIVKLVILAEKFGECITYPEDKEMYGNEMKNTEIKKQGLYPIVFRYMLDTHKMSSKNITITQLAAAIESNLNGMCYCVYSEDILHLYFNSQFEFNYADAKKSKKIIRPWEKIVSFASKFNEGFIVNNFSGITSVDVKSRNRTYIKPDGSIGKKQIYYLQANGINMKDVLTINVVDKHRTSCSHVVETFEYFGMLDSRDKFVSEISNTFITLKLAHNNYVFPANVMFERGYPTNLTEKGQKIREPHDVLLHSAFKNPINALRYASVNNINNNMTSPSSNLMLGQIAEYGTTYNKLVFNETFIKSRTTGSIEDLI